LVHRPWVVVHHTDVIHTTGRLRWQERLKLTVARFACSAAVSRALAERLSAPRTIPNPYRENVFGLRPLVKREHKLVFLGRLVEQKGLDLLLEALHLLRLQGLRPELTVIGDGDQRDRLERMSVERGLADQVAFVGEKCGEELVDLLNAHAILVVPSRPFEAFGLVALEGIACGCVVVGSAQGGIPEAIGPCGVTFRSGDVRDLSACLGDLLRHPERLDGYRAEASAHLARHTRDAVASAYVGLLQEVLARATRQRGHR
jgi:glycosyltransferase involved in cell wall biosynthesis